MTIIIKLCLTLSLFSREEKQNNLIKLFRIKYFRKRQPIKYKWQTLATELIYPKWYCMTYLCILQDGVYNMNISMKMEHYSAVIVICGRIMPKLLLSQLRRWWGIGFFTSGTAVSVYKQVMKTLWGEWHLPSSANGAPAKTVVPMRHSLLGSLLHLTVTLYQVTLSRWLSHSTRFPSTAECFTIYKVALNTRVTLYQIVCSLCLK